MQFETDHIAYCFFSQVEDTIHICMNHLATDPTYPIVHELCERDMFIILGGMGFEGSEKLGDTYVTHLLCPYGDEDCPGECANFVVSEWDYAEVSQSQVSTSLLDAVPKM